VRLGIFQNLQWPEPTVQREQFDKAITQALIAEQLGFDSAYFVEHHWTRHGILSSTLAVLAYLAGRSSTIRLGTAVLVLPLHNPARMLEEASTVDLLSGGRLEMGVGRGFGWKEFDGFGQPLDESQARYDESLAFILKAWREPGTFSFHGKFWSYNDISVEPKPLQRPHPPVWAAVGSPDNAARMGRLGLRIQISSGVPMQRIPGLIEGYRVGLAEAGLPYSGDHVLVSRWAHLEATRALAWEIAAPAFDLFRRNLRLVAQPPAPDQPQRPVTPLLPNLDGPVGKVEGDAGYLFCTPDECCGVLEDLSAMGVGQVIFQGNVGGMSQEDVVRSLRLIGNEVLPHFAARSNK